MPNIETNEGYLYQINAGDIANKTNLIKKRISKANQIKKMLDLITKMGVPLIKPPAERNGHSY